MQPGIAKSLGNAGLRATVYDRQFIGAAGIPTIVLPADPEDRFYTRAIAEQLTNGITDATSVTGTPVSPSPLFPDYLDVFTARVVTHLRTCQPKLETCNDQSGES